jgi:peptide-methionine (S)-S-oxide reductase
LLKSLLVCLALVLAVLVAVYLGTRPQSPEAPTELEPAEPPPGLAKATFAGGCFWCTEAVFRQLNGVRSVVAGYSGGSVPGATYYQVATGTTGHAEAVQVTYDPAVISYEELLEVFWQTHDPTTPDRQGADVGPQYRSVIFYHTEEQKRVAERSKRKLDASGQFAEPIVTQIVPFTTFYRAEANHQNYFERHAGQLYCRGVIRPKVEKVKKLFRDKLKPAGGR